MKKIYAFVFLVSIFTMALSVSGQNVTTENWAGAKVTIYVKTGSLLSEPLNQIHVIGPEKITAWPKDRQGILGKGFGKNVENVSQVCIGRFSLENTQILKAAVIKKVREGDDPYVALKKAEEELNYLKE